ncbi:uncharacterized protein [Henckelia pumila]|uniref:uncharacterized protein n=1 Tax=Henckelia pumila TaxID=405737 RepID=UPI003C6E28F2
MDISNGGKMQREEKGLTPLQKCTAAIRQLAYGGPADQLDEYLRMGETTALECLSNFCQCVMQIYGVTGSRNDINVLNESPLFNDILKGNSPEVNFIVNGTQYTKGYYLADDIYPEWSTFVKSFSCPQDPKRIKFKQRQEAARKDVERAFGVLQARLAIIRGA